MTDLCDWIWFDLLDKYPFLLIHFLFFLNNSQIIFYRCPLNLSAFWNMASTSLYLERKNKKPRDSWATYFSINPHDIFTKLQFTGTSVLTVVLKHFTTVVIAKSNSLLRHIIYSLDTWITNWLQRRCTTLLLRHMLIQRCADMMMERADNMHHLFGMEFWQKHDRKLKKRNGIS